MRATNAIDFWRGAALVMIFINHIPGNAFSYFTLRNFAIVDAAELFVFLAGWSLYHATGGVARADTAPRIGFRLVTRAIELYRAHLVTSVMAFALCAGMALATGNALYLDWNGAGPMFQDPPRAIVGLVTLSFQLGYFNILPLYVVLLLVAPVLIVVARVSPVAGLTVSLLVYGLALVTRLIPPAWPAYERWYFNPLSWQLLLVMGYLAARLRETFRRLPKVVTELLPAAATILLFGLVCIRFQLFPDPIDVPEPRMLFLFDKTYLSPARLISIAALVLAFSCTYSWLCHWIGPFDEFLCSLGRNSLAVFSVGSLLSLVGQFIRFSGDGGFLIDLGLVASGIGALGMTAWFVEWRERLPAGLSRQRSS